MARSETRPPDHSWQAGRGLPALASDYFRVDERSQADLVAIAIEYARLLTYFELEETKEPGSKKTTFKVKAHPPPAEGDTETVGAWEKFFRDDVSFLLAQMCMVDAAREYRESLAPDADLDKLIADAVTRLVSWYRRGEGLTGATVAGSVEEALVATLRSAIGRELAELLSHSLVERLRAPVFGDLPSFWKLGTSEHNPTVIYSALNRVTAQTVNVAKGYLTTSLKEKSNHAPHNALYLTFVTLLQKSQEHLNGLTERHLAFYYEKVLRLAPSAGTPDRAHVSFRLSPQVERFELPAGAWLAAADTPSGPVIYRTDQALTIDRAEVVAFKALNVRRDRLPDRGDAEPIVRAIRAYPVANSGDGFGAKLDDPSVGWQPFGPTRLSADRSLAIRSNAEVGVAIAAPILNLREGMRDVELVLRFAEDQRHSIAQAIGRYRRQIETDYEGALSEKGFARLIANAFSLSVTTKKGFRLVRGFDVVYGPTRPDEIAFRFQLTATEPPLEAPAGSAGMSDWPMLKLYLNPSARSYGYSALHGLVIVGARISVKVRGLRSLNLQTGQGPVDASKPFPPFGTVPEPGAYLLFANSELWRKRLSRLRLNFEWVNLPRPPADLASHYAAYGLDTRNDSFRATFSARTDFRWQPLAVLHAMPRRKAASVALFPASVPHGGLSRSVGWDLDVVGLESLEGPPPAGGGPLMFSPITASGFFRLELTDPAYGFGHSVYPRVLASAAKANAGTALPLLPEFLKQRGPPPSMPEPPFVPMAANVTVDYDTDTEIGGGADAGQGLLYHLHPFGQMALAPGGSPMAGAYAHDGYLYLGIRDLHPPQTLTLLFHVHESTAEQWSPLAGFARPSLGWSYLADNRWVPFPGESILADETYGLLTSGIVKLALPADISDQNTILDRGLFWLMVAIGGDPERYGRVVGVTTQAVTATRVLDAAAAEVPPTAAAGTITRLVDATPQIAAVDQPFRSTGGRAAESATAFRVRVSERLRHKQRAVQPGDFERLVLQAFPDIHEAKCFRHTPGHVTVVVTPVRRGLQAVDRPRVSLKLRHEISGWLHRHTSTWAEHITVRDPSYEVVKIVARVVRATDGDASFIRVLEQALDGLIAPWRLDPDLPMHIGTGVLDLDALRAFMEDQSVVRKVAGLSIVHSFRTGPGPFRTMRHGLKDTARGGTPHATLRTATPCSVLVPATPHDITVLGPRRGIGDLQVNADFVVSDPDKIALYREDDGTQIPLKPTPTGIGDLAVGRDLIVTTRADARPPQSRIEVS